MSRKIKTLKLKRLGIDTYKEAVIFMHQDCQVCKSEGFEAHARVQVTLGDRKVLATLNIVENYLLKKGEVGLSNYAWDLLRAKEDDEVFVTHPTPLTSLGFVRSKIYGNELQQDNFDSIISDIATGRYTDIHIAAFLTACAGGRLNEKEIIALTRSMIKVGDRLEWPGEMVVDKHSVGGLPGNCTSLLIVPIVAAFGLTMPKTSSRAITSPAGTADIMEVLAPVELNLNEMRTVVNKEQGCIVWGGAVALSPADDVLIRVEKVINLDSEGQLVASVLSKKIAVGSSKIVIDIPIGDTAKVRSLQMANLLKKYLIAVGDALGVTVYPVFSDGAEPAGFGIGPALEARDILAVLQNTKGAPALLREHALTLAGHVLEFSPRVKRGQGKKIAEDILTSGKAWNKFQAICEAQGGMRGIPVSHNRHEIMAPHSGRVKQINNRELARVAKLAGAPEEKTAGVELHVKTRSRVNKGEPLFTIHAGTKGELAYALKFLEQKKEIIQLQD